MDWTKIIDKFFGFLCGMIPGSVVLMVAALHHSDIWTTFWKVGYLGYQTKLAILIAAAFVAGSTVNSVLGAIVGGVSSTVADRRGQQSAPAPPPAPPAGQVGQAGPPPQPGLVGQAGPPPQPAPVPAEYWQDFSWRNLVTAYLGKAAPENLQPFVDQNDYNDAVALASAMPQPAQARELAKIARRNNPAYLQHNDAVWRSYWNHLHAITAQRLDTPMMRALTLVSAYGGASLVVLVSAPWTPLLRHWWILLPSIYFLLIAVIEVFTVNTQASDPAQLFEQQWQYLRAHVGKGEQVTESV